MRQRHPLQWPVEYPRTKGPIKSRFDNPTLAASVQNIIDELERLIGKYRFRESDVTISSNIPLKNDGYPRADYQRSTIHDKGVAVYFKKDGKDLVICCDKYNTVESNMHAIYKTISALRDIDRWGVSDFLNKSFTGFQALPSPDLKKDWWIILGFTNAPSNSGPAKAAYLLLAKKHHPDVAGGSKEKFQELLQAWNQAQKHYGI